MEGEKGFVCDWERKNEKEKEYWKRDRGERVRERCKITNLNKEWAWQKKNIFTK